MKLNTVNVIELTDGTIQSVRSFDETPEGNKEAEALFTSCAEENGFDEDEVAIGLDEGTLEGVDGSYALFIVHST